MKSLAYLCQHDNKRDGGKSLLLARGHLLFTLESSKDLRKIKVGITACVGRKCAEEGIGQDRHDHLAP